MKKIPRPSVVLITGRRESGKDVTACAMAEILHKDRKYPIVSNYDPKEFKLPKHWELRSPGEFKPETIQLISDVHLEYFYTEWHLDIFKALVKMVSISRHNDIDFIYTTQSSDLFGRKAVRQVDVLLMKEPSFLDSEFERPEIRGLTEEANEFFGVMRSQQQKWESALAFTHTGKYKISGIVKPKYFTSKMSKVFGRKQTKRSWIKLL